MEHPCKGCVDAVESAYGYGGYECDYLTHNGKCRSSICGPREKCTVKSIVPRPEGEVQPQKRYEETGRPVGWDMNMARWLYGQDMTDDEIAKRVGTKRRVIQKWRARNGLPAKFGARGKKL